MTEDTSNNTSQPTPKASRAGQTVNDIVKRTTFSLSGLEQTPYTPQQKGRAKSTDGQNEQPENNIQFPTQQPIHLSPHPDAVSPADVSAMFFSLPTEPLVRVLPAQRSHTPNIPNVPPPSIQTRATIGKSSYPSTLRISARFFVYFAVFGLLLLGAFAYFYVQIIAPARKVTLMPAHVQFTASTPVIQATQNTQVTPILQSAVPGTKNFQVGAYPFISIKGFSGNVHIAAGNSGIVTVQTNGSSATQGVEYQQARDGQGHDTLHITTATASEHIDYTVTVPSTAIVQIAVSSGSVSVDGVSGVTIVTMSGGLTVQNIHGSINISTVSGDVTLHNIQGQMTVQTVNGSIRATTIGGQLRAVTQNGDVLVQQAMLNGQSTLKTMYGSVQFAGILDRHGTYTLQTRSGNVRLMLSSTAVFQLHISTASGSVHNDFGNDSIGPAPQAQIIITIGSGSVIVSKEG